MRKPIAASVAMIAAVILVSPVAAGTYIYWHDHNGNGIPDTWLVDDDGNTNTSERMVIDSNENGRVELQVLNDANSRITSLWLDPNEDGAYEIVAQPVFAAYGAIVGRYLWYDSQQNGRFEIGYYDGNLDGYYEYVCVDRNYDGVADFWAFNTAPRGRTATDDIARRISAANWVNNMHARGYAAFFPTVTVPLP